MIPKIAENIAGPKKAVNALSNSSRAIETPQITNSGRATARQT